MTPEDLRHFKPSYKPWDQRLCVVPDGDLFKALRKGKASVLTDQIVNFTENKIQLASGTEIPADIVITATGLKMEIMEGIRVAVDGAPVDFKNHMTYKAMMLSGVPNLVLTIGYTNASWTLKADLTANWMCRLINSMNRRGLAIAVPRRDTRVKAQPFLDFTSGYVRRALDHLPKQGDQRPWKVYQNYFMDLFSLRYSPLDDGTLELKPPPPEGV
jgi:cyclohexanone monooxygenase